MGGAALQPAAHVGDDAEFALVIAPFRNLQIAEMPRCQRHARGRQQINEGIGIGGDSGMDRVQHLFILMRAGDGQNAGVVFADIVGLRPQTARDDHAALGQPSDTMPMVGWPRRVWSRRVALGARSGRRSGGFCDMPPL